MSANQIKTAQQMGVKGFNEGRKAAPALNSAFITWACGVASGKDLVRLMKEYSYGWSVASCATAAVDVLGDHSFPSVSTLREIMA